MFYDGSKRKYSFTTGENKMTKIKKCVCSHEWQDRKYGDKNRVANQTTGSGGSPGWRCTVCGKEIVAQVKKK